MGFGFVYMLNSSFIALLASVESESYSHISPYLHAR